MTIIVTGPESSGTHWIQEVLLQHPDVQRVESCSFPNGNGDDPESQAHYPALRRFDPDGKATVVAMCRERHLAIASQKRRGFHRDHPKHNDYDEALDHLRRELRAWPGPSLFVSYDTLVTWGHDYFRQVLSAIGLCPDKFPSSALNPVDANAKYFRGHDVLPAR